MAAAQSCRLQAGFIPAFGGGAGGAGGRFQFLLRFIPAGAAGVLTRSLKTQDGSVHGFIHGLCRGLSRGRCRGFG